MASSEKLSLKAIPSLGLVLTAAIWGFSFVIVKDSLSYVGAVWMIAFRFSIAAVLLALLYCKKLKLLTSSYLRHGALLGFFLFAAYVVQTIGCNYTTAGKNAFLTAIYVILVPLFGWPLLHKRPSWFVWVAAVVFLTGVALLSLNKEDSSSVNIGDVLTLLCGVFFALHIVYSARYDQTEDPVLLSVLQFFFCALFSWIAAPLMPWESVNGPFPTESLKDGRVIVSMLYLGVFSTMVGFTLQTVCLKIVPSALASLFLSLEAVFGGLFGALFLKEALSPRMWIGCALIFFAILLAEVVPQLTKESSNE